MIVNVNPIMFTWDQVNKICNLRKATYICETCVRAKSGEWANQPVAVFYTDEPHPQGSNWFGLYFRWLGGAFDNLTLSITNAQSALEPFQGVSYDGENVFYSRYRHDFRDVPGGFVDGGRDYLRYSPPATVVKLQIVKDKLEIINEENPALGTPTSVG